MSAQDSPYILAPDNNNNNNNNMIYIALYTKVLKRFTMEEETISNYKLHTRMGTEPITQLVQRKRWKWISHVLHMPPAALPRVALRWTPDGRRKRGRPKETWRRTVEKEMEEDSWTWGHLERRALYRSQWHTLTEALCVSKHEED